MNFLKKILGFFKKTKEMAEITQQKIKSYIKEHSKQIKVMMSVLEVMFPAQTGIKKMTCLVTNVCYAIGLEDITPIVAEFVKNELQKQYDKFKKELNNGKET